MAESLDAMNLFFLSKKLVCGMIFTVRHQQFKWNADKETVGMRAGYTLQKGLRVCLGMLKRPAFHESYKRLDVCQLI